MGDRPCFSCAPGHETLAAELADFVAGTWETTHRVANVMIMANGATVPAVLPAHASHEAVAWVATEPFHHTGGPCCDRQ
jgi:hypothetical protein